MGYLRLAALLLAAAFIAVPGAAGQTGTDRSVPPSPRVGIFYYPWFGTPRTDGHYVHWQQGGNAPPATLSSNFYPTRGPYSSADTLVVNAQMREIAATGVGTVITSWWGRGSLEDRRLPQVIEAARAHGLAVAAHLEPYEGRTVASTEADIRYLRAFRISDFYVWASASLPDAAWAELNERLDGVRTFANTNLAGKAAAGRFDGLYTYDVLLFDGTLFPRLCGQAHRLGLLCAPSVGPGYDARRATGNTRVRSRRGGATYDSMWRGAVRAHTDLVTITSYNEWHEGTQIEPAQAGRRGTRATKVRGACAEEPPRRPISTAPHTGCGSS